MLSNLFCHNQQQTATRQVDQKLKSHLVSIFDFSFDLKVINSLHISKSRPHPEIAAQIEAEFYNWTRIVQFSSLQFSWFSTSFIGPIL